jgi:acyl-CoA synthetase (NDP forming)
VLNAFGLPMIPAAVAGSEDEAAALAAVMGFPVMLRGAAGQRSEKGAVRTHLDSEPAVRAAWREIVGESPGAGIGGGVLVQPTVRGVETRVGLTVDPCLGPIVTFGPAGVEGEARRGQAFRIAPLTDGDADGMVRTFLRFRRLAGVRDAEAVDLEALREILLRVSTLGEQLREIAALDLNPVLTPPAGHGCRIVEAHIRVVRAN